MRVLSSLGLSFLLAACGGSVASVGSAPDGGSPDGGSPDAGAAHEDAGGSVGHDSGVVVTIDSGTTGCNVTTPIKHRPLGSVCPTGRGPGDGDVDGQPQGQCKADSDCTQGANGRCLLSHFGALTWQCSYDECASDSDCPGSTPCDCRTSDTDSSPNVCGAKSTCRVDSDCGLCGFCSPTEASDVICSNTPYRFACHVSTDACTDDSDCAASNGKCNFDPSVGHWACVTECSVPPP